MIRVKLSGGLGNQLFQYACALSISKRLRTGVLLDLEYFRYDDLRKYSLSKLQVNASLYNNVSPNTILQSVKSKIQNALFPYETLTDPIWDYDERITTTKNKRLILDGYWGIGRYFDAIRATVLDEFRLKPQHLKKIEGFTAKLQQQESVAIHLRFGDYISRESVAAFFGTLEPEYYRNALAYLEQKLINPVFYIFSDDKVRAIETLTKITSQVPFNIANEHNEHDDVEELFLMAACKHIVIANSTFGWWASWLNQHEQKIIIQPRKWFKDEKAQWVYENRKPLYQANSILI